jgi:hypothetical protein
LVHSVSSGAGRGRFHVRSATAGGIIFSLDSADTFPSAATSPSQSVALCTHTIPLTKAASRFSAACSRRAAASDDSTPATASCAFSNLSDLNRAGVACADGDAAPSGLRGRPQRRGRCRAAHGKRSAIVARLPYRCAVPRIMLARHRRCTWRRLRRSVGQ